MVVEEPQTQHKNTAYHNSLEKALPAIQLYNHNFNGSGSPEISVIMPAFNEERAVGHLLDRTQKALLKITPNYEIIVVDDGSHDQTLDICREKHVTIIHNPYNWGKGYALREGFKQAHGDFIITMDSDGDHNPEDIPLLLQPLRAGKIEAVFGSRFMDNRNSPVTTVVNTFGNRLFNFLIRNLTNRKFTDTQCGFRAFNRNCLSTLQLNSQGYDIETEMIVQLARQHTPYCEIPVRSPITYLRKSNINRLKDGFRILFSIFKARVRTLAKT